MKLAVVESSTVGNDGLVRSATIRTKNGVTNRPVSKLYPLEVAANDATSIRNQVGEEPGDDQGEQEVTASELSNENVRSRPKRGAAQRARQQILKWTECIRAPPPPKTSGNPTL